MERERIYKPTGTGLCKTCGHDVGAHDGGHMFVQDLSDIVNCIYCRGLPGDTIHDVGRVLRCPEEASDAGA